MKKYVARNFKLGSEGLGKVLGHLEREIMEALWKAPRSTSKEVLTEIRRSRDIAVTTVFTVLERLVKKGLVIKSRTSSVYTFEAAVTRDELARTVSKEVMKGVLDLWSGSAMASFVDIVASKDPDELDRLSKLISTKKLELEKEHER